MRNRFNLIFLCLTVFSVLFSGCAEWLTTYGIEKPYYDYLVPAEDPIPGLPAEVNFADYWIRSIPNPDDFILTPEEIKKFNSENPVKGTIIKDITEMSENCEGADIRRYLAEHARYLIEANYYITGKIPLEKSELHRIIALMDTSSIPDAITIRFGIVLNRTMGKLWPTMIPLFESIGDNEFDQGVAAAVDTGEPVALLHTSKDGLWSFVRTSGFSCWIPSSSVAFGDRETVREFVNSSPPLVATGHRVSVYGNPEEKTATGSIQMGSHLPVRTAGNDFCEVLVPGRGRNGELTAHIGYIRRSSDVSIGYLPYTFRNVFRQCFLLFNRRFGWGGMYEERDCSEYIKDVFRCFNIRLPRNSTGQSKASKAIVPLEGLDRETRLDLLGTLPGGISLLYMPGHIMIYLGEIEGKPYAISDFWAWRSPSREGKDIAHRVARVAVTDLMLGAGSKRGSFLDRITYIIILGNYEVKN